MLVGICLALAAHAEAAVFVAGHEFTLAWTHSIERVSWLERYRVTQSADAAAAQLHLEQARIRGSAAGMEPPEGARLEDGWYVYAPRTALPEVLRLSRSRYTADYTLCTPQRCAAMSQWLPSDGDVTLMWACARPEAGQ